ncbi:MAG: hypothetical protein JSR53_00310 [Proteobacteria bacterium]|nr:hypothetical protein [Pseudomonadota bacterium]
MAAADLIFRQQPVGTPGPVPLVFGDDGGTPSTPDATLHGSGRLTGLRLHLAAVYDINVSRPTVGQTAGRWQDAAPLPHASRGHWQQSAKLPAGVRSRWQDAAAVAARCRAAWSDTLALQRALHVAFEQARRLPAEPLHARYQEAQRLRSSTGAGMQQALRLPAAPLRGRYQETYRDRQRRTGARFEQAAPLQRPIASGMGIARRLPRAIGGRYQQAWPPRPGQWQRPAQPGKEPCYLPALPAHLLFADPWTGDGQLVFVCERRGPGPGPEPVVVVPVRKVYIVLNNITLHRVDTGAELHAHSFSMSLDHQSWTWSWQASLHHDAATRLGRDNQGDPAELAITVNGLPFRLRLERVARDRRFSPTRWNVSGKGKASILGAPYATAMQFGNPTAARTAQQLMADVLTINGVGIGWTVDWGLQDWLVPAGAWALQGCYIDAINDIAAAAGGYVQPHPTDSVLRILPSYPAAPWAWDAIAPDFEIPADAAEVEGSEYIDQPAYNRVFVGGVGMGVFGPFKRAGTAGDVLAPQVTHALITDAVAHRQRGVAELSNTGRQEHITLNMQVLPETGVIVPGQFVRYLGEKTVMGIVRSTSVDWSFPKLRQTIKLETHV